MARTCCLLGLLVCIAVASVEPIQTTLAGGTSPECLAIGIAQSRELGPEGLDKAFASLEWYQRERDRLQQVIAELEAEVQSGAGGKGTKGSDPQKALAKSRLHLAGIDRWIEVMPYVIDQVGGQRGCTVSRLYWYTDLGEARSAAERSGRPILSLRMLGKLTDEYSCANSRFFRTALYSNREISDYLRDNFVLHWQSVRPVPRVTIDFGDGRKLERTLTGNSAHHLLTSAGQPLDVLPGLYAPQVFRAWLDRMQQLHVDYAAADKSERAEMLAEFHRQRRADVYRQWVRDIERIGGHQTSFVMSRIDSAIQLASTSGSATPLAVAAARMAETKTAAEAPLLRFANYSGPWIEHGMDDALWLAVANLRRANVKLDESSVAVMRREFPVAELAGQAAFTKSVQESPVLRMVRSFENSMALDTVRNEYLLHRRIHEQFADGAAVTADADALNEWVYAELFLTPSSDPWLGLAPRDVYTALENDGRVEPSSVAISRELN